MTGRWSTRITSSSAITTDSNPCNTRIASRSNKSDGAQPDRFETNSQYFVYRLARSHAAVGYRLPLTDAENKTDPRMVGELATEEKRFQH